VESGEEWSGQGPCSLIVRHLNFEYVVIHANRFSVASVKSLVVNSPIIEVGVVTRHVIQICIRLCPECFQIIIGQELL
jgi:hypothetical protein